MEDEPLPSIPHFRATRLEPSAITRAYPLARAHNPKLELRNWTSYARSFSRKNPTQSGLIGLIDSRAYIHGLFAYTTECLLTHGKTLRINDLMLCHLPGSELTIALLDGLIRLAHQANATTIIVSALISPPPNFRDALLKQGFTETSQHQFLHTMPSPCRTAQLFKIKA
jgi:hypothetical protein